MARIMPIFLGVISISISAGVLVYWVTTNAWQIGQQHVMLRGRTPDAAAPAKEKSGKGVSPDKPASAKSQADGAKAKKNAGSRKKRRKR
jgi:YidC/Oxa1 family membrane protein insertase